MQITLQIFEILTVKTFSKMLFFMKCHYKYSQKITPPICSNLYKQTLILRKKRV